MRPHPRAWDERKTPNMNDKTVASTVTYHGLAPFCLEWQHRETSAAGQAGESSHAHSHDYYEIYVHIFGDVSFSADNRILLLSPGDVVIVKPYESHRYIYNRPMANNHFTLALPADVSPALFSFLNDVKSPCISPSEAHRVRMLDLCGELVRLSRTENVSEARKLLLLSSFLVLLEECMSDPLPAVGQQLPADLTAALEYIHAHLSEPLTVQDVCRHLDLSKDTLSRLFQRFLNVSPYAYVQNERLVMAKKCLSEGCSVSEACERCGFSDYSHFISRFRKVYGITPLKFRQRVLRETPAPHTEVLAED